MPQGGPSRAREARGSRGRAHVRLFWCLSPHPRRRPQFPGLQIRPWGRRTPESTRRPTPYRPCGGESGAPGGRAHVGLLWVRRLAEPWGKPGRSLGQDQRAVRHPRPNGDRPAGEKAEAAPATGSARPATPPPCRPAPLPRPSARAPGRAAALPTPTHSLRARPPGLRLLRPLRAFTGRQPLPLLAPGSAPGVFPSPALPRTPLPQVPPDSAPCRRRGARPLGARRQIPAGGSARDSGGPGLKGGGDGEGGEKSSAEGRGKRRSPLCK